MTPPPATDPDDVPPALPAATVMLVRDAAADTAVDSRDAGQLEVFMLRRTAGAAFAAGFYVFPGGKVDSADGIAAIERYCTGPDDATASAVLGVDRGGLAYWVAAIRECFEESGVLLAHRADGSAPSPLSDDRILVHRGELSLVDLCRRHDLVLDTAALSYIAHWVTPPAERRRRFDTRFFLAAAPVGQDGSHDQSETVDSLWVRPATALARADAGELMLMPPTVASLQFLAACPSVADAERHAAALDRPPRIEPNRIIDDDGRAIAVELPDGTTIPLPS